MIRENISTTTLIRQKRRMKKLLISVKYEKKINLQISW